MILDENRLSHAINSAKPINKLFTGEIGGIIDNYTVSDYVSSEQIPMRKVDGREMKTPAIRFFEKYSYTLTINANDAISRSDEKLKNDFRISTKFPHDFEVHLFSTFLVVEILPRSSETEFLVIAPRQKGGERSLGGILESGAITALLSGLARDAGAQVAFLIRIDGLLEYLRTGLGKRKFFGLL